MMPLGGRQIALVLALLVIGDLVRAQDKPPATFDKDIRPFLKTHCFHCHGNGKQEADLSLDKYTDDESLLKDRKTWENVKHMLRAGEMPPKERPRPPAGDISAVLTSIDDVLDSLDCHKVKNVGRVTLRRLNRVEYNNTIRDLVGVDFQPAADFPADDVGYGFDNIGDVLSTTPLLLERYLAAAETIFQKAIIVPEPLDIKDTRLMGFRLSPKNSGETIDDGAALYGDGEVYGETYLDAGEYIVRAQVYAKQVGDEKVKAALRVNRETVKELEVTSTDRDQMMTLEAKVRVRAATNRISVALLNPFVHPDSTDDSPNRRLLIMRGIVLEGPYDPPKPPAPESHRKLMAHAEDISSREAAREIVARFARRAFRRPVKDEEIERILAIYDLAEKEGDVFEERVRVALCRVLVSPHFLFRIEIDPPDAKPGQAYQISDYELASRLSYFLWSTMPDDELMSLADKGELRANLRQQVERMIKDQKSSAFVENFAGQWLTLRKLAQVSPDKGTYKDWDDSLRRAMQRETELFFEAILREDRSILDFLDADFTFVNGRLAYHYGIKGVLGREFERVKTPPGRGGLLTQASILTLTSNPTRTAPVKRGKWVLEQLLGTPPPPPPPNVPDLPEKGELKGSLRQVMEQHRENAICASCHARMDPIGFAFENYDGIGAYREKDGNFPIDSSGELPDGQKFQGPDQLKQILKGKKELFARALSEKILTYALGRGTEYYDQCAVDTIVAALEKNDYRFSTLIQETVASEPFLMRTASGQPAAKGTQP
jgi:Protein of unknown function (DUF1592)/Protein of unknown function (DUF1588)/Protein of unknown function (DUF1587)/Protein of unknown function (DUF1585)/Protein of unknown function (DUF1595)/Planctomycete cytochrome C